MVEPFGPALRVAAVEGADLLGAIRCAAIAAVVAWVAIGEAVGEHEVDDRVAPVACDRLLGRFGAFEQQQTVTAGGGLQPDPAVADHGRGAGQCVAQGLAVAEHLANGHLHCAALPWLADRGGCLRLGGLDRQQAQGRRGAGLDDQPIASGFRHFVAVNAVCAKRLTAKGRRATASPLAWGMRNCNWPGARLSCDVVAVAGQGIQFNGSGSSRAASSGSASTGSARVNPSSSDRAGRRWARIEVAPLCFLPHLTARWLPGIGVSARLMAYFVRLRATAYAHIYALRLTEEDVDGTGRAEDGATVRASGRQQVEQLIRSHEESEA